MGTLKEIFPNEWSKSNKLVTTVDPENSWKVSQQQMTDAWCAQCALKNTPIIDPQWFNIVMKTTERRLYH